MTRRHDWPEALARYLQDSKDAPFEWGANDCALFVCSAVEAMTSVDMAADVRGTYSTRDEAESIIAAHGSMQAVLHFEEMGLFEIPLSFAGRGDVVMMDQPSGHALGIVDLDGVHAVATGIRGLVVVQVKDCIKAWRVPY